MKTKMDNINILYKDVENYRGFYSSKLLQILWYIRLENVSEIRKNRREESQHYEIAKNRALTLVQQVEQLETLFSISLRCVGFY